jgi:hypothetical protein
MKVVRLWSPALSDSFLQNLAIRVPALGDLEKGAERVKKNKFYGNLRALLGGRMLRFEA